MRITANTLIGMLGCTVLIAFAQANAVLPAVITSSIKVMEVPEIISGITSSVARWSWTRGRPSLVNREDDLTIGIDLRRHVERLPPKSFDRNALAMFKLGHSAPSTSGLLRGIGMSVVVLLKNNGSSAAISSLYLNMLLSTLGLAAFIAPLNSRDFCSIEDWPRGE